VLGSLLSVVPVDFIEVFVSRNLVAVAEAADVPAVPVGLGQARCIQPVRVMGLATPRDVCATRPMVRTDAIAAAAPNQILIVIAPPDFEHG